MTFRWLSKTQWKCFYDLKMLFLPRLFVFLLLKKICKVAHRLIFCQSLLCTESISKYFLDSPWLEYTFLKIQKDSRNDLAMINCILASTSSPRMRPFIISAVWVLVSRGHCDPRLDKKQAEYTRLNIFKVHFTEQWTLNTTAGLIRVVWFCFMNRSWLKKENI